MFQAHHWVRTGPQLSRHALPGQMDLHPSQKRMAQCERCSGGTCFAEGGERGGAGDGEALLGGSEARSSARGSAHIIGILRHVAAGLGPPPAGAAQHGR